MIEPPASDGCVLTFGEALVGYSSPQPGLRRARTFKRFPGGADLNVAVGLGRLGTRARWASVLSEDQHGDYLVDVLAELGIETVTTRRPGPTALMFKAGGGTGDPEVLQVRAGTAFARHAADLLTDDAALWRGITHLHLTGIVLGISAEARAAAIALLDAAEDRGLPVSFDPNLRLNLWPSVDDLRTALNAVAGRATILLPGLAEARLLTGLTEPAAIADHYLADGAAEVVVKLGREGAQTWTTRDTARSRSFDVRPVDTVGAGDGFAAGYLDGFVRGLDLQGRVDQAAAVGALVTTRPGDLAAMPSRAEVDALTRGPGQPRR